MEINAGECDSVAAVEQSPRNQFLRPSSPIGLI
jgi:hypothetical protein